MGYVSFEEVQECFPGLKLVNGGKVSFRGSGLSYGDMEFAYESDTHWNMRLLIAKYFLDRGEDVCEDTIGIEGCYTFADLAVMDDEHIAFVECLSTKNATREVVEKKLQLQKYGQVWLVFVGNTPQHKYPPIIDEISHSVPIFLYTYGNYFNKYHKQITEFSYRLNPAEDTYGLCGKAIVDIEVDPKRKYMHAQIFMPQSVRSDRRLYVLEHNKAGYRDIISPYRSKPKRGKVLTMEDLRKRRPTNSMTISSSEGIKALEDFIAVVSDIFTVNVDLEKIQNFKQKTIYGKMT